MTRGWRAVLLVASVAALLPVAPAQVTTKAGKGTFRIKWVKGKSYNYSINVSALIPGSSKVMNNPFSLKLKVLDVAGTVGNIQYQLAGGQNAAEAPQTVKVDALGKSPAGSGLSDVFVSYPTKPLAVGESYTVSQPATNTMFGRAATTMKMKFKGVVSEGGRKVASFDVESVLKGASTTGSGKGTMTVNVADGMVLMMKQSLSVQAKSTDAKGKTQTTTIPVQLTVQLK